MGGGMSEYVCPRVFRRFQTARRRGSQDRLPRRTRHLRDTSDGPVPHQARDSVAISGLVGGIGSIV
jgi:hypothetical protein